MKSAILLRTETGDQGTFGKITTDSGFMCYSGELPWRNNEPEKSCIPEGKYRCNWRFSPKHGLCYHVEGVPGRSNVEIHSANWMGDKAQGLKCELLGCIAPGVSVDVLDGQRAVIRSKSALLALQAALWREPFDLTVKWGSGVIK